MKTSNAILGILGGIAAGVVLGVLMAPDSGKNTRQKINSKTHDMVDDLRARINTLADSFTEHQGKMEISGKSNGDLTRKVKG
jgi:gas vesicle protein